MTSAELRAEMLNARVVDVQEDMNLNEPHHKSERLKQAIWRIRKTPEFQTVRQFIVSESSEDQPDYSGLRRMVLETFAYGLDMEIDAVKEKRKRESA